jgi:hypothetical protein
MDALKYFCFHKKQESVHMPLLPLITMLMMQMKSSANSTIEELEDAVLVIPVKALCLSLINNATNSIEELQQRFLLRSSFWNLGLKDFVKVCLFFSEIDVL